MLNIFISHTCLKMTSENSTREMKIKTTSFPGMSIARHILLKISKIELILLITFVVMEEVGTQKHYHHENK
jgi:hypothetical protein